MKKLRFLFFFFLIFFLIILIKLFSIQVLHLYNYPSDYLQTKTINPERGKIFDRNSQPLVLNQDTYQLYIEPKKMDDKQEFVEKIAKTLSVDEASIEARIDMTKDWLPIKSNLTREEKDKIDLLKLKGIGFNDGFRRYYPESSLSAHLLGFVGKNDKGEDTGYFGIEGYYDQDLSGLPGVVKTERDLIDRPIFIGTQEKIEAENGRDLTLTIDKSVQTIIKNRLIEGMDKYKAKAGCVITADPYTMQILGFVCLPDFELEKYYSFSEDYFKNPAISNLYEPGSTFKPFIMASAIEEKAVKPNDYFNEDGPVTISGYTIVTSTHTYEGKITMTRILERSSNVGMVYIGSKLGQDKIYKYLQKFDFGQKTGIDLQGEASSYLKAKENWYPIDYSTVTFGQGIAVTPIQLIKAFSSVINGGNLMKPYIVMKIQDQNGIREVKPKVIRRVISEKTSEIIKKMLIDTVNNGYTKYYKPTGYNIGGKSGTAQIPVKGKYDASKTIASFIAFAPAQKPKFIVLVILNEPELLSQGSDTAGPIAFDITKDLYVYYNIRADAK